MSAPDQFANAIRFLSVDAIQKANSGHPGMPLGMADIATVLWREFLKHNPNNPKWHNRDRFVLSNGHGSMLLYSLLHLTGYALTIDDIKSFRQLHSKTPGHPEFGLTAGVETTTGPLGQGLANAVGMALAEKNLAAQFNRPGFDIVDHYTYAFVGDGCLMEGISHEVSSLAGTLGLGKLIVFWDDNNISIDGHTSGWFTEDVAKRFRAYNWHVVVNVDGHNADSIRQAITEARAAQDCPSIICCKTMLGFGAPTLCGTHNCHGSPLGDKEIMAMREKLGWQYAPFIIPEEIYSQWNAKDQGQKNQDYWQGLFNSYQKQYPDLAAELLRRINGELPKDWSEKTHAYIEQTAAKAESLATRQASQNTLNAYGQLLPELLGGSADLTASNLTNWSGSKDITNGNFGGNYIRYGVREFGMFAIMNGIALHGGAIPYGGTFLVFASYGHSAIRMAAIMKKRVIYVLSHDSIGLGEDGPTHQPVEQLSMLRATPNVSVWRPCDSTETAVAWQYAIERSDGPTALALSRQKLIAQLRDAEALANIKRGGYILVNTQNEPDCILIATGSEVALAANIAAKLQAQGKKIRVVSMPSQDVFDQQDASYKNTVLPPNITKRIAIEAAASQAWYKYVGTAGKIMSLDRYGESALDKILFEFFGFSEQNGIGLVLNY
jgi:transketolase